MSSGRGCQAMLGIAADIERCPEQVLGKSPQGPLLHGQICSCLLDISSSSWASDDLKFDSPGQGHMMAYTNMCIQKGPWVRKKHVKWILTGLLTPMRG